MREDKKEINLGISFATRSRAGYSQRLVSVLYKLGHKILTGNNIKKVSAELTIDIADHEKVVITCHNLVLQDLIRFKSMRLGSVRPRNRSLSVILFFSFAVICMSDTSLHVCYESSLLVVLTLDHGQ